jgi:hypothetical protein
MCLHFNHESTCSLQHSRSHPLGEKTALSQKSIRWVHSRMDPGRGAHVCSRVQGTIPGWLNPACPCALIYVDRAGGTSDIANHPGHESGNRTHS